MIDFITDLARRYNGYVVESNLIRSQLRDGTPKAEGFIRIRVPADRLQVSIEAIEELDLKVIRKDVSGEDITAEYVDLKSRLRNLEDAAEQLKLIMENATDTEAVLEVYKELTQVNEEAEVIRGQILYYEEAAAMSSLLVDVRQIIDLPTPTPTPTPEPWRISTTFEESGERVTRSFQYWLEDVVRFFIYGLPIFILRAGPWLVAFFFIGRWGYRKFLADKKPKDSEEPEE